jgi:hypothetical protein
MDGGYCGGRILAGCSLIRLVGVANMTIPDSLESLFSPVLTVYTKTSDDLTEREDNAGANACV